MKSRKKEVDQVETIKGKKKDEEGNDMTPRGAKTTGREKKKTKKTRGKRCQKCGPCQLYISHKCNLPKYEIHQIRNIQKSVYVMDTKISNLNNLEYPDNLCVFSHKCNVHKYEIQKSGIYRISVYDMDAKISNRHIRQKFQNSGISRYDMCAKC